MKWIILVCIAVILFGFALFLFSMAKSIRKVDDSMKISETDYKSMLNHEIEEEKKEKDLFFKEHP